MDWVMLSWQLIRCGHISGFRPAGEINPEYIGGNCPPIGVAQSQAFEAALLPFLFQYYNLRRNQ